MPNAASQEQTIYRRLAGQIQCGFYEPGGQFPSVQEIACQFGVSFCPAQRALKRLERDGLVLLRRGQETEVLQKRWERYLETDAFRERAPAIFDLSRALRLLSPCISAEGICRPGTGSLSGWPFVRGEVPNPGKRLYRLFELLLRRLDSQLILSFYYDAGAFFQSAVLDILKGLYGEQEADRILDGTAEKLVDCWKLGQNGEYDAARRLTGALAEEFLGRLEPFYQKAASAAAQGVPFEWEPYKGRTRFCDDIAIDLICKINRGTHPVGELLPHTAALGDTYHVSSITMRRTMSLLNKMGIVKTSNGIGTRVISAGDSTVPQKLKDLTLDDNLKLFLEALQLLAITGEEVIRFTFPSMDGEALDAIAGAVQIRGEKKSMDATIGACLQAVVRCCPIAALREVYGKMTLLLLKGSVLRLGETGEEPVPGWAELSQAFRDSLRERDGLRLAALFRGLIGACFAETKQTLLEIGVAGVEGPSLREDAGSAWPYF